MLPTQKHLMKKNVIFIAFLGVMAAATLGIQSCSKVASLLSYNLALQTVDVVLHVPPVADTLDHTAFATAAVAFNVDSFIKANTGNTLSASNISSAKVVKCQLAIQNPTTDDNFADFSKFDFAFSSDNVTAGTVIATVTDNPDSYADTYTMPVDSTKELSGYLHGTQFIYTLGGKLRRSTTDTVNVLVHLQLNVKVHG